MEPRPTPRRRWRDYTTQAGRRPVAEFIAQLSDGDAAAIVAAMKEISLDGLVAARHVRGDIYEVRADGAHATYRILFALQGRHGHVLLALEAFSKKSKKTPITSITLAQRRLADWQSKGRHS